MKWLAFLLVIIGCTDTDMASLGAFGDPGHIICYSGGKVILDTTSTGRIQSTRQSDGWEFKDAKTNKFIRISDHRPVRRL